MAQSKLNAYERINNVVSNMEMINGFVRTYGTLYDKAVATRETVIEMHRQLALSSQQNCSLREMLFDAIETNKKASEEIKRLNAELLEVRKHYSQFGEMNLLLNSFTSDLWMYDGKRVHSSARTQVDVICRKHNLALSTYDITLYGIEPTLWHSTCKVGGTTTTGQASTKKEASNRAAENMLDIMLRHSFKEIFNGEVISTGDVTQGSPNPVAHEMMYVHTSGETMHAQSSYQRRQQRRAQEQLNFADYVDILHDEQEKYEEFKTEQYHVKNEASSVSINRKKRRILQSFNHLNETTNRNLDLENMIASFQYHLIAKGYDVEPSRNNCIITQHAIKTYHYQGVLPTYHKIKRLLDTNMLMRPQVKKGAHKHRRLVVKCLYLMDIPQTIKDNYDEMFGQGYIEEYVKGIIKGSITESVKELGNDALGSIKDTFSHISTFIRGLFKKVQDWWTALGVPAKVGILLTASFVMLVLATSALWSWVKPVYDFFFGKELKIEADTSDKMRAQGGEIVKETVLSSLKGYLGEFNELHAQTDKCTRFIVNLRTLKDFFVSVGTFSRECFDDFHKWIYGTAFTSKGKNLDELKTAHERLVDMVSNTHVSAIYGNQTMMREFVQNYQLLVRRFSTFSPTGQQASTFHQSVSRQMSVWKPIFDQCSYNLALIDKNRIRIEPLCLWLHGKAGGGKTYLVPVLQEVLSQVMRDKEFTAADTWSRNPNEEYYSGYHGQWCCVYEEALQTTEPTDRVYQANDIISMVGTQPLSLPMADLGSKGVTFFESDLLLVTTNDSARPLVSVTEPHALYRRYFAIEITENKKILPEQFGWTDLDTNYKFLVHFYDWTNPDSYQARKCNFTQMINLLMEKVAYNRNRPGLGNRFRGDTDPEAVLMGRGTEPKEMCGVAVEPILSTIKRPTQIPQKTWQSKKVYAIQPIPPFKPAPPAGQVWDGDEEKVVAQGSRRDARRVLEELFTTAYPTARDRRFITYAYQVRGVYDNCTFKLNEYIRDKYGFYIPKLPVSAILEITKGFKIESLATFDILFHNNPLDGYLLSCKCHRSNLEINVKEMFLALPEPLKVAIVNFMAQKIMALYPNCTDLPPSAHVLRCGSTTHDIKKEVTNHQVQAWVILDNHNPPRNLPIPSGIHLGRDQKGYYVPLCHKEDFYEYKQDQENYIAIIRASLAQDEERDYDIRLAAMKKFTEPITTFFKNPLYTSLLVTGVALLGAIGIGFLAAMGHQAPEILLANSSHPQLKRFERIWAKKKLPKTAGIHAQSVDETFTQLARKCINNTRLMKVHFGGNVMHSFITFYEGSMGFTPNHSIPPSFEKIEMYISPSPDILEVQTFTRSEIKMRRWPELDKCKVVFPAKRIPAFKSLRSHVPEGMLLDYTGMTRITYSDDGETLLYMPSTSAKPVSEVDYDFNGVDIENASVIECMDCVGIDGDCGTVYLLKQNVSPKKIPGIHGAGSTKRSYCIPIFLADLDAEVFGVEESVIVAQSEFVPAKGNSIIEGDFSHHDVHLPVVCNLKKPHYQPIHTAYIPSIIQEGVQIERGNVTEIHKCPWEVKMAPAVLKGGDELTKISLSNLVGRERLALPPEVDDDECWEDIFPPAQPRIWSKKEAINGIPGQMPSIDVRKCCGYPECDEGIKRSNIVRLDTDPDGGYLAPDMEKRIDDFEIHAMQGIADMQTFVECKKDELRPKEKVEMKKTRSFFMGTFALLILFRRYFGFWLVAISQAELSPFAIGLNPFSTQWWQYYWKFKSYSEGKFIDSKDFKGWDLRYGTEIFWKFWSRFLKAYALDKLPKAVQRIYCAILYVHFNVYLLVTRTVYQADIMVSGGPGTAALNSVYNIVINRAASLRMMRQFFKVRIPMKKLFFLVVLGDDNYKALRQFMVGTLCTTDVFTPENFSKYIQEMFGLVSTSATKGVVGGFQTMEEADFTKRRFVRDSETGIIMCPMTLDDIQQHLLWVNSASDLPPKKQITENVHSALKEIFFHGRKVFDEQKAILNPFLESISEENVYRPTWDDIYALYIKNLSAC